MPTAYYYSDDFISVDGTVASEGTLLGDPAGDGQHLVGSTILISADIPRIQFETDDADGLFEDDDADQLMTDTGGTPYPSGARFDLEYELILRDDATGIEYTVYGVSVNTDTSTTDEDAANVVGFSMVGTFPPRDTPLTVVSASDGPTGSDAPAYTDILTEFCFTPGTSIETPFGPRRVETLATGDFVLTRDRGPQPIRWKGTSPITFSKAMANEDLRPVRIAAGSIAPGVPSHDLSVSPDHRILLSGWRADALFGAREVLASARSLLNDTTIQRARNVKETSYIHIAFDQHEVITSNGLPTESLQPLATMVDSLQERARSELLAIFPHLATGELGTFASAARRTLSNTEAKTLSL